MFLFLIYFSFNYNINAISKSLNNLLILFYII